MPISNSATREKDLISGHSVWAAYEKPFHRDHQLHRTLQADVVVVGAGISGAFMAHALSATGKRIVVVDRRSPAQGSTSASTALLQWEIDTPLTELHERIGAKATRAWQRSYRATQDLVKLVEHEGIRCGLQRRQSLYLAGNESGSRALRKELQSRRRAGLPGEYLDGRKLLTEYGIARTGAILSPDSAVANPVQLATGLLRRAMARGVKVYSPVEIKEVFATKHGVVLDADDEFIEAKHAIFCTGYELLKGIPTKGTKITSSWAISTRPNASLPSWLHQTVVWEASKPYLYMRTTPDRRLIVGGEDEDVDRPDYRAKSIARKSRSLLSKLKSLIPDCELHASYRWSGAFGESLDGLPIIDAVPGMPNCFAVLGFGGNGTIYSVIASQIVPKLLHGKRDRDADIFGFR